MSRIVFCVVHFVLYDVVLFDLTVNLAVKCVHICIELRHVFKASAGCLGNLAEFCVCAGGGCITDSHDEDRNPVSRYDVYDILCRIVAVFIYSVGKCNDAFRTFLTGNILYAIDDRIIELRFLRLPRSC